MAQTAIVLSDSTVRTVFKLFGDAAEARTLKIDPGILYGALNANGYIIGAATDRLGGYSLYLQRAFFDVASDTQGLVKVSTNGDAPNTIITFSGSGERNFQDAGIGTTINCQAVANSTGNIFVEFTGAVGNTAYTLILDFKKNPNHFDQGQTRDPMAFNQGKRSVMANT
jgi:hypothetical protein